MLHKAQHSLIVVLVKTCPCFFSENERRTEKTTKRRKTAFHWLFFIPPCLLLLLGLLQLLLQDYLFFVSSLFACYKTKGGIQRIMMLVELRKEERVQEHFSSCHIITHFMKARDKKWFQFWTWNKKLVYTDFFVL